ncbi:DddA-like double-stranded DNA deaminase toxin [Streptomyces sp. st140]|uniref:DddA-like double-stranded DNA deaminase toxin n=1 Tax=Streptomyces sp. st140 TaxID=1828052 RepID=UPI0015CF3AE5|nr:DddA-like double-stranded DNA deaminase toxin [Streptomyces sp. st140]
MAKQIYALARETETAELDTRTDAAIEQARSMKATSEAAIKQSASAASEARSLQTTAADLAEEAARPDVDVQATAAKGRQLAMQAMKMLGPWQQEAAARALSGTDQDVLDYLRTRWKEADQHDIRQRVVNLSTQSPVEAVRTAATAALAGSPEQVEAFQTTGQYEAGSTHARVEVAHLATTGGTYVSEAAEAVLKTGTPRALAEFLQAGRYGKQLQDERILTARLATEGGPELKAAATIALAGPAEVIHEFVTVGQYMAQRKDDLATTHQRHLQGLLAEGAMIAAKAYEDAWRAAEAAAKAINAAKEAEEASDQAKESARQAQVHADDADASAGAAETSAAEAAESAATARDAANRADADAESAENSAANAAFSAAYARESARKADRAKEEAYASKKAAGASETEANAAAAAAWKSVQRLAEEELEEAIKQATESRKEEEGPRNTNCVRTPYFPAPCQLPVFRWFFEAATPGTTTHNVIWEISGLADIQKCITSPVAADCALAATGLLPWGKLKLLGKIDEGVEALQSARGARRSIDCLTSSGSGNFRSASESCPKWAKGVLDRLPKWEEGDKTVGELFDINGDPIPDLPPGIEQMKSGEKWYDGEGNSYDDPLWAAAQKQLYGKKGFPAGKHRKYKASSHVETKYAIWMEQQGIEHATVVINNNAGVCDKAQNCADAVGHILPYGSSLTVYYPGDKKTLWGARPR